MSPNDLVDDIREYCVENADPAMVEKYARYFKGGYDAYGLSLDQLEGAVMSILEGGAGYKMVQQASKILVLSPKYEETSFAILLTKAFEKDFNVKSFNDIESWFFFGIKNWAHADVISTELIFPMLKRGLVPFSRLDGWRTAENSFQRRAVPVSLIKLLKSGGDLPALLSFIEPLMMDKAREVQQGVGWFLREAWKMHKAETEVFLTKWKDKAPRLIYQYATEKMSPEEKERYRKNK